MEKRHPEEILSQLRQIYNERDQEYRKWEEDHNKKVKLLDQMMEELAEQRERNAQELEALKQKEKELGEREDQLQQRERDYVQQYVALENMRSESIRIKKDAEDLRFNQAVEGSHPEGTDMTGYVPKEEHDKIVSDLENTIKNLTITLLKHGITLPDDKRTESHRPSAEAEVNRLTIDDLRIYLSTVKDVDVRPQSREDQIDMQKEDIIYRFTFTLPPEFQIISDKITQEVRERIERDFPELQVDVKDQTSVAGFFTEDITPEALLRRVFEIGDILQANKTNSKRGIAD